MIASRTPTVPPEGSKHAAPMPAEPGNGGRRTLDEDGKKAKKRGNKAKKRGNKGVTALVHPGKKDPRMPRMREESRADAAGVPHCCHQSAATKTW